MVVVKSSWSRAVLVSCALAALGAPAAGCSSAQDRAPAPAVARQALATPAGTVPGASHAANAVLLSDGRVLVVGGVTKNGTDDAPSKAAALFDPATNQWAATGNLNVARAGSTAIRLGDGRVLISGGDNLTVNLLTSNEVYDPATGVFSMFGNLSVPRMNASAVLLSNGSVMVAGGAIGSVDAQHAEIIGGGEIFNWLGPWHGEVSLTRTSDHTILALFDDQAWLLDETTFTWAKVAGPLVPRRGQKVIRMEDGRLLMLGGQVSVPNPSGIGVTNADTALAELFDPVAGVWSATGSLSRPSGELDQLTTVPGGDVLLIGAKLRVERYSATAGTWSLLEPLSNPPITATALGTGGVLVTETIPGAFGYTSSAEVYDSASPLCSQQSCAQKGAACGPIDDGCGNIVLCGSCAAGQFCNAGACACNTLTSCAAANKTCGTIPDGCGGTLSCGTCSAGQTCTNNVCVSSCVPLTCSGLGKNCGAVADGCGGTISCGTCPSNQVCGSNNVCATPPPVSSCSHSECSSGTKLTSTCSACSQKVCASDPYCCNTAWDSICANEGKSMCTVCGAPTCTPSTCSSLGKTCGSVSNGCGGTLSCGSCALGQTCTNNVCTTAPTSPPGTCAHSQCSSGAKLVGGCTSCVSSICAADSFCCASSWDSICVSEVASVCKLSCP